MVSRSSRAERKIALVVKPTPAQLAAARTAVATLNDDALAAEQIAKKFAELGWSLDDATKAVATARSRIKKAASKIKTKEEIGVGLARLNEIYKSAAFAQDGKTALAAEKERCKLLALYDKIEERETATVDREKDEARRWLESALTDVENVGSLGLDDLARIAVYRIVGKETS